MSTKKKEARAKRAFTSLCERLDRIKKPLEKRRLTRSGRILENRDTKKEGSASEALTNLKGVKYEYIIIMD